MNGLLELTIHSLEIIRQKLVASRERDQSCLMMGGREVDSRGT
jgi:hypothetical protein